jgi:hypothetical protein
MINCENHFCHFVVVVAKAKKRCLLDLTHFLVWQRKASRGEKSILYYAL